MCRSLVRYWDLKTALRDAVACNSIVEYEMCIAIGAMIAIKSIMYNVSFSPSRIESRGVMLIMLIRRIKQVL